MTGPFRSARDISAVLGTYQGAERLFIEEALVDDRLARRREWSLPSWRPHLRRRRGLPAAAAH